MPEQNPWSVSRPLEFLQKVRYGGIVGKKAAMCIAATIILGITAFAVWGQMYAVLIIAGLVVVVLFFSFRSIDKTVKDHPEAAMMDGTELLRVREIEARAKGMMRPPDMIPVAKPVIEILPTIEGGTS